MSAPFIDGDVDITPRPNSLRELLAAAADMFRHKEKPAVKDMPAQKPAAPRRGMK